jgi:hypothetical protein
MSHFALMCLYALILALFFAALWKRDRRQQVVLFLQVFIGLMGGAIVLGWIMYFLPPGPPAPIP